MIKTLLSAAFLVFTCSACAQIASVQAGNFGNAGTWDCGCVPSPNDDLTISHHVVFTSDVHISDATVEIMAGGSLYGSGAELFPEDGSVVINRGSMNMGGIQISGQATLINENSGYIYITGNIVTSFSSTIQNAGSFTAYDLYQGGSFANKGTASLDLIQCNGTLINDEQGNLSVDSLYNAHQFYNYGHSIHHRLVNSPAGYVSISGSTVATEDVEAGGQFVLEATGTLNIAGSFTNDGQLYILGAANCEDFANGGELGGGGKLCILDASVNSGTVSWINVCDQTGSTFDTNTGTISPDVVFCSNGNCAELGLDEQALYVSVFPNPAADSFTVSAAVTVESVQLYALTGELIASVSGSEMTVDGFAPGMYFAGINGIVSGLQRMIVR